MNFIDSYIVKFTDIQLNMEAEMFTMGPSASGGGVWGRKDVTTETLKENPQLLQLSQFQLNKSLKSLARFSMIVLVFLCVYLVVSIVPKYMTALNELKPKNNGPTQKENLQWLGASADVVRGDYENNQDSLAEKAMKDSNRVTDVTTPVAPAKATFISRERMSTPEEEALKKFQS